MTLGESTVTACLLIHSMKMQMLLLASELPDSFTTCSSLVGADFVHNCGLGFRLAYTFKALLIARTAVSVPENEVSSCARSLLIQYHSSSNTDKEEEKLELLQNRSCSSSAFARASAQDSLSAWILPVWGCHVVSQRGPCS